MRDCGMCAIFHTCDITIFIFQVMAMGIALGVTVFATGVGAVAALAALGPIGPFVAIGVVVSKNSSVCSVVIIYVWDRLDCRCHRGHQ